MSKAKFWSQVMEMWRESSLIQGILTLTIVLVWLGLVIANAVIPDQLNMVVSLVIGYYFGSKSQQQARAIVSSYLAAKDDC